MSELDAVRQAMTVEWTTALTQAESDAADAYMSPEKADFFEHLPREIQRVRSDPHTLH